MELVGGRWNNWSGGVRCTPRHVIAPREEVELAAAIRTATGCVRAPGTGHSFTPVCASDDTMLDLAAFRGLLAADTAAQTATFSAATPLWAVGPALHAKGLALANMGDIDRQTLAGVVATGTHGTGRTLGSLSAQVSGFRLITADGEVLNCSADENPEVFELGRVSIGTFGVMSQITIKALPAYRLVERNFALPIEELFERLDSLIAENRHFEFFWFPYANKAVCKSLNLTEDDAPAPRSAEEMYARGEASGLLYMNTFAAINEVLPFAPFLLEWTHRLFSRLMPGPDKVRWSYEIFPSPRTVRFNEMEYAIAIEDGPACLKEVVRTIRAKRINTGFPIEYRTVKGDDIPLSPFYGRDSATVAVHQYRSVNTEALFSACEAIFRQFGGRPHWGKRHTRTAAELEQIYPHYDRFVRMRAQLDPKGRFLNAHLRALFG
ncbi:MAG: FAD-binding protein [Alphaproteobacteria bacterium]|nr:FAD-binding protein [Alphaproteobacteria bacterium]